MEDPFFVNLIITAAVTSLVSGLIAYAFWLKKREKVAKEALKEELDNASNRLELLTSRLDELEKRLVGDGDVRKIVQEEMSDIRKEMIEQKEMLIKLTELMSELRIDLGVLNYIKDKDRARDT